MLLYELPPSISHCFHLSQWGRNSSVLFDQSIGKSFRVFRGGKEHFVSSALPYCNMGVHPAALHVLPAPTAEPTRP